jgi:hypothetical protein
MIDDDDSELFQGQIEISALQRGASFGLDEESYFRLANFALTAGGMGIDPAVICTLPDNERGCPLTLFGKTHSFDLVVRVLRSTVTIAVFAEPLDGLRCVIPLYEGQDCDAHWSRALRSMLAVEGTHYVDQYWAEEQQHGDVSDDRSET